MFSHSGSLGLGVASVDVPVDTWTRAWTADNSACASSAPVGVFQTYVSYRFSFNFGRSGY